MTSPAPHQRFTFDTVFDNDGGSTLAAPRAKKSYTPEEVEQIKAQAFAEGERSVVAQTEIAFAAALQDVARAADMALPALARVAHDHRSNSAELAMAVGRKIADAALLQFPEAPVAAALTELAREIEAAPRLTVKVASDLVDRVQSALSEIAQGIGFAGALVVTGDVTMPPAAFTLEWGDGKAAFDPHAAAERVTTALHTALAAEGLHAEPLTPAADLSENEADHG